MMYRMLHVTSVRQTLRCTSHLSRAITPCTIHRIGCGNASVSITEEAIYYIKIILNNNKRSEKGFAETKCLHK